MQQSEKCAICLQTFNESSVIKRNTCCRSAVFHYECLLQNCQKGNISCPICRNIPSEDIYDSNAYNEAKAFEAKEIKRLYTKARKQVNEKKASKAVARAVKVFDDYVNKQKVAMKKKKEDLETCKKARNDIKAAFSRTLKEYENKYGKASMKPLHPSVFISYSNGCREQRRYRVRSKRLKKRIAILMGFKNHPLV